MSVNNKECVVCNQVYPETYYFSAGVKNGKSYKRRYKEGCLLKKLKKK